MAGRWGVVWLRVKRPHRGGIIALLALLGVLSGCARMPSMADFQHAFQTDASAPQAAPVAGAVPAQGQTPDPVLAFVAAAAPGASGVVVEPSTNHRLLVVAEEPYHAASGFLCRRFRVSTSKATAPMRTRLACRDPSGHWARHKLLVNPESLAGSRGLTQSSL